ncbi:YjzC family protein [Paraburkholderia kirstenboschensis]|uniref:YjzC family protein n=1 Tax=Paraburkholderia kirstenboschensis TaxID=1245436 RepID=A0ABZ0EQU3_9BURK|nr:YjzC family protein [Paraburkholderia kirstenboschensis]WOD18974.1 YjzC family protein [Paraburkholderia kirstenboschensis]
MAEIGEVFKPGDKVPNSGIYIVTHDTEHAKNHEVTCVYGKKFPPCKGCGNHPRFKLKYKALHIESNDNFS